MRTTVMFAPDLMRAAKARSAERGESLKAWLTRAVEAELGREAAAPGTRQRMALPMFGGHGAPVRLSGADLERALADADAAAITAATQAGGRHRSRRRRAAR
jgi:hypothetical protein